MEASTRSLPKQQHSCLRSFPILYLAEEAVSAADHEKFLRHAVALSAEASLEDSTGGIFGAVIVKDNKIISKGTDRVVAGHDRACSAEMEAMRLACTTLQSFKLTGCTLEYENYQYRQIAEEARTHPL